MRLEQTLVVIVALLFASGRAHGQANTLLDPALGPQPATGFKISVPPATITASFTFSPSSGAWPLTVQFVDTTQGGPASWAWDFGDGGTSTSQNPIHVFNAPSNTFTIQLTATGPGGFDSATHSLLVTNPVCPASMTLTVNQQVTLTGQIRGQALVFANNALFLCTRDVPSKLIKWSNLNDLTSYQVISFPNDGLHDHCVDMVYDTATSMLVVPFPTVATLTVSTVDPVTLTIHDVIADATSQNAGSVCSDGVNTYVAGSELLTSTLVMSKYRMSDWTLQGRVTITNVTPGGVLRFDGTNLYGASTVNPGAVYRINLPSLNYQTNSVATPYGFLTDDMALYGNYFYCGQENSSVTDGVIIRVKKDDLSSVPFTNCASSVISFCLYYDSPNVGLPYQSIVWDAVPASPSVLVAFNPNTFQMWKAPFPTGINAVNEIVSDGTSLFMSTWTDPPMILRAQVTK